MTDQKMSKVNSHGFLAVNVANQVRVEFVDVDEGGYGAQAGDQEEDVEEDEGLAAMRDKPILYC